MDFNDKIARASLHVEVADRVREMIFERTLPPGFRIDELELSVRSFNCLKRAGVETIGELLQKSESELGAIPNFGQKSIDEVIENLNGRGYELRQD